MLESFTFYIGNHWSITGSAISRVFFWAGRLQNGVGKSEHKEQLFRWQTKVRVLNNSKYSLTTFMQLSMLSLRVGEGLLTGN